MRIFDDQYILVTGGAGFIGSCLIRHLNDMGLDNIVIVDDLGMDEKWQNLVGKRFVDIVPIGELFNWLRGKERQVEACIHLGANSSTVERDADLLLENNYRYTKRLCNWCVDNDVRFIYASSAATYGDGSKGFSDDEEQLEKLTPLNMYGYSKHLFDLYAKEQGLLDKIVGLKYFNVFGPNEGHKGRMSSVVPKFVKQIQDRGFVELFCSSEPKKFGDGDQVRDFLYVKDAVKMTEAFLRNDAAGIFNIGAGKPESWNKLTKATFSAMAVPEKINYIAMPDDLKGKYQNYTCADMNKSRRVLGHAAHTMELELSVQDYVQNHLLTGALW